MHKHNKGDWLRGRGKVSPIEKEMLDVFQAYVGVFFEQGCII